MKKTFLPVLAGIMSFVNSDAQTFPAAEYLDVNLIKARHMVHGDMWWDPGAGSAAVEYPQGTGKHCNFLGSVWVCGRDNSGDRYVSAQLYRTGNDFWPGPLDAGGSISHTVSGQWAKIWKVEIGDIATFLALGSRTVSTIPTAILEWPAKGNIYAKGAGGVGLTISSDMAPFVDVDGDNIYDPVKGDYPRMKGDQMLWWVYNDNGPTHDQTNGKSMKLEFHASAYAYKRAGMADRMLFYEFLMINKSSERYNDFRFGVFSDADLGYPFDDYIAFDSAHRMGIEYNAAMSDAPNGANSYGEHPPLTGFSIVEMPGDVFPSSIQPAGTFTYFESGSGIYGIPAADTQYYHVMLGKDRTGGTMPYPGSYAYPITEGAVMCDGKYPPGDRRYLISSGSYAFQPTTKTKIAMVFMVTDTSGEACGGSLDFKALTDMADSAWHIYYNPLPLLSTKEIVALKQSFRVYPNPSSETLFVEYKDVQKQTEIKVVDALGRVIRLPITRVNATLMQMDISTLSPGVYSIIVSDGTLYHNGRFIKE